MNTNTNTRINDLVAKNRSEGFKALAIGLGVVLLAVIVAYTGYHNYRLFSRGLDPSGQVFALIPVLALEGGALWLLVCAFAWFTDAKQKAIAATAEIVLIFVIALNVIVDHNLTEGTALPDWLVTYRTLLTPAAPVAVFALIVLLLYLDPSKRRRDMAAALAMAQEERMFQAKLNALSSDEVESAYVVVSQKLSAQRAKELVDSVPSVSEAEPVMLADEGSEMPRLASGHSDTKPSVGATSEGERTQNPQPKSGRK
jgi:hypothetical protein